MSKHEKVLEPEPHRLLHTYTHEIHSWERLQHDTPSRWRLHCTPLHHRNLTQHQQAHSVKKTWLEIRDLVNNKKLIDVVQRDKYGNPKINKTGVISSAPNFPKSKTNDVFVRGSATDSTTKSEYVNGIAMYAQNIWIKREALLELIHKKKN